MEAGSIDHQILASWIADGCPGPRSDAAKVTGIEVRPRRRVGVHGFRQQLRVVAAYSDGTQRDVTAWAKYDSLDKSTASVSDSGLISVVGQGQAPIMVRFRGQAETVMVIAPLVDSIDLAGFQQKNFVDKWAAEKFRQLGIPPSPLCDDATFLRRAFLDTIGTLPSPERAIRFLDSKNPKKRSELVDELLGLTGDPKRDVHKDSYAAFSTLRWSDLVHNTTTKLGELAMWSMNGWMNKSFRDNKPFDRFVSEIITARGSLHADTPAGYYQIFKTSEERCEATAQLFLGVRLMCAKCHHHPFESYGQDDYYGMAAYFARVQTKNTAEFGINGLEFVVYTRPDGEVGHPKTGKIMSPVPLGGKPTDNPRDRRIALAAWLTSPDNTYFRRNIVNRYVKYMLGRGLVEPVDDLRQTNPPTNPELMEALAADLAEHKFDIKHLLRTIMNSRLYQLSSQPTDANASDTKFYSHFVVKRLTAEQLLDAIDHAAGTQTKFETDRRATLPLGTRAIELPDAEYKGYFLKTFGKPRRVDSCECERVSDPSLAQTLHLLNGDTVSVKVADKNGRIAKLLAAKTPHEQIVEQLYLSTICRRPNDLEQTALQKAFSARPSPGDFYEDLLWGLINSKEFLFVH